jgi:CBS domain containing-hemolysin-like protein
MEIEIGITCLLLAVLAFLATVQRAFGQLSDVGLRRLITEHEDDRPGAPPSNAFLSEILEDRARFRSNLTAVIQILLIGISVLTTSLALRWFPDAPFILIAFLLAVGLTTVFRQLIPRFLSLKNPEKTFLQLLPVYRPFYRVVAVVAAPWHRFFERRQRRNEQQLEAGADEDEDNDDIQALIDVGEEEGIIEQEEGELIHTIIEFGDTRVSEVMTPRTDIVALPITATVRQARDVMIDSKYSRLPVYRDQIDNVEGIIYVRDLLQCWPDGREDETIVSLLRTAYFVPETKAIAELLQEMQKAHVQLSMVIDEYGGLAGLVTLEDILEEIHGEIEDEDIESEEIVEIVEGDEGYYEVAGSTEVGKIEELFDLEIEDDDFTTIAGLVINASGTVPRPGTQLTFRGLDVEVLEADERRIGRLRLRRALTPNGDEASE